MRRCTGVLFDLDGTLTDRARSIRAFAQRFHAAHLDRLALDCCSVDDVRDTIAASDAAGYAARSVVCDALATRLHWRQPVDAAELLHYWRRAFPACTVPRDGMAATIDALHVAGIRLGVISNGNASGQRRKLEQLGIHDRLDVLVISDEVGLRKPDPAIFHLALERLPVETADGIWFVGDHPINDVAAARAIGMIGVWLRGVHAWPADVAPPAHAIDRLDELLPLVCTASVR